MKKIGEILVEQGKLSERDVERALLAQNEMGEKFGQVLIKLGLVSELDFAKAFAEQQEIPLVLSSDYPEEAIQIEKISRDFLLAIWSFLFLSIMKSSVFRRLYLKIHLFLKL